MLYKQFSDSVNAESKYTNKTIIEQAKSEIENIMISQERFIGVLKSDDSVSSFFRNSFNPYTKSGFDTINEITKLFGTYVMQSQSHISMYLYSPQNNYIISSQNIASSAKKFEDNSWVDDFIKNPQSFYGKTELRIVDNRYLFTFFYPYDNYSIIDGLILINIDTDMLKNDFALFLQNNEIIITNNTNDVIFSSNYSLMNKKNTFINNTTVNLKNKSYTYVLAKNSPDNLKIGLLFDNTKHTTAKKHAYILFFFILLLSVLISIFFSYSMAKIAFKPIQTVMSAINNPELWTANSILFKDAKFEELNYIITTVLNTTKNTAELKKELSEKLNALKLAQATALQAQIQPHFLFNTLETINMEAYNLTNSKNKVSLLIKTFSQLLYSSFRISGNIIAVSDEIEHAKKYLEIQKIRYEDKFDFNSYIDENVYKYKTIKLTLQPLLENAIYHGIKPLHRNGKITLNVYEKDNFLLFEVKDDGVGINNDKLITLKEMLQKNSSSISNEKGIGLFNVNQRAKLLFGDNYGITIDSSDSGTTISFTIPKIEDKY